VHPTPEGDSYSLELVNNRWNTWKINFRSPSTYIAEEQDDKALYLDPHDVQLVNYKLSLISVYTHE
jgi:hypothetical protein